LRFILIDMAIKEEGLYVYNMHNRQEIYFSISIVLVRSQGGSLVSHKPLIVIILCVLVFAKTITMKKKKIKSRFVVTYETSFLHYLPLTRTL
jgi:hypothetical protein